MQLYSKTYQNCRKRDNQNTRHCILDAVKSKMLMLITINQAMLRCVYIVGYTIKVVE